MHIHTCLHLHLLPCLSVYTENEFTLITHHRLYSSFFPLSTILILFSDCEKPRFSVYSLVAEVLGWSQSPGASPHHATLLTWLCSIPCSRPPSPSTHTLPCPSSVPVDGFWTGRFRKGKGKSLSYSYLIVYILKYRYVMAFCKIISLSFNRLRPCFLLL